MPQRDLTVLQHSPKLVSFNLVLKVNLPAGMEKFDFYSFDFSRSQLTYGKYRVGNGKCKIFYESIGKIDCSTKILHLALPKR